MEFKRCSIGTKNIFPTPPPPAWTVEQGRIDPCFPVLYDKFWLYHLNVAAEIETHQTRQRFSNLLLSDFGESVWIVSSVSWSYLTGAAPGVVFCCWSPSASGFDVLCVQRWYSAYLGCNKWLFELLLPFYHLKPVWPFSSDINQTFSSTQLPLTGYFSFSDHSL